jgi:hypothetical protein
MSDSETLHSIKYQNSKGENLLDNENNKKLTSDTEYYFNLIANPSKMIKNKNTTSSQSDLQEFINNSDSDTDKLSKNSIVSSYTNHNNDNLNLLDQLSDNPKQDSKQIYETMQHGKYAQLAQTNLIARYNFERLHYDALLNVNAI